MSIGGATALEQFDSHLAFSGNELLHHNDFRGYFEHPQPSESDNLFFENGIAPVLDQFNLDFDHLAGNHDSYADDLTFDDFINHDDQPSTEIQPADQLAETTASLQPQLGASSYGCDDGGLAVSV